MSVLDDILHDKVDEVRSRAANVSLSELKSVLEKNRQLPEQRPRGFVAELRRMADKKQSAVIAEVKKASGKSSLARFDLEEKTALV